jgi:TrmH family RNA methyltransferase
MGSIFNVALARTTQDEFARLIAGWPGTSVGTHLAGAIDYRTATYGGPVLLVMGAEQAGLTPALAAACGTLVKIPMAGKADSLNLAIATGVMLFEIRREDLKIDG